MNLSTIPTQAHPVRCIVALICVTALLSGCSPVLSPSGGGPSDSSPGASPIASAPGPAGSFVTWNPKTTIPFAYFAENVAYMGLWDLEEGTLAYPESPLFSVDGMTTSFSWDGGDRFAFGYSGVEQLDSRIRIECIDLRALGSMAGSSHSMAAPSGSASLFVLCMDSEKRPVLDIRNHPLAGKIVMDPPELAPGTSLERPLGIEVGDTEVLAYFTTWRLDKDLASGEGRSPVYGLIQVRYHPEATARPLKWRVINPEIPAVIAGSGPRFWQSSNAMIITSQARYPQAINLTTGLVSETTELVEGLREADPDYTNADVPACCYRYGDHRIWNAVYSREDDTAVSHVLAFRGPELVGRIEFIGDRFTVYKDGLETSHGICPESPHGPLRFPQSVEQAYPDPVGGAEHFRGYDAIWREARYADLFNETLRTDGATAEQIAVILMARFTADPAGFVQVLSATPDKEVERVGDSLAYNADYGDLGEYRKRVEDLKKDFPSGKELDVLDKLLDRITQYKSR